MADTESTRSGDFTSYISTPENVCNRSRFQEGCSSRSMVADGLMGVEYDGVGDRAIAVDDRADKGEGA